MREHNRKKLGLAIARSLKSKPRDAVDLMHGDMFMFVREKNARREKASRRPAKCIGIFGSLVVGWNAASVNTAHNTRSLKIQEGEKQRMKEIDPVKLNAPNPTSARDFRQPLSRGSMSDFLGKEAEVRKVVEEEYFHDYDADPFVERGPARKLALLDCLGSSQSPLLGGSEDQELDTAPCLHPVVSEK